MYNRSLTHSTEDDKLSKRAAETNKPIFFIYSFFALLDVDTVSFIYVYFRIDFHSQHKVNL